MYSPVRAWTQTHTRRDRFTLSAHFSFGRSMRLKKKPGFTVNTVKKKKKLKQNRGKKRKENSAEVVTPMNDSTASRTANKFTDGSTDLQLETKCDRMERERNKV